MMDRTHYDVVVIGGGSAGCVAAARLSEDPAVQVLLLEAGPDPQPIPTLVADARQHVRALLESPYLMMYPAKRKADGSTFYALSGRIMGGGSSVNIMAAQRPIERDMDCWVEAGNPDWSWDKVLPVLKALETDKDFPDSPLHGSSGPTHIERPFSLDSPPSDFVKMIIDHAVSMGLPLCPDLNVPNPVGAAVGPLNVKGGIRQSTTVAYLDMARPRPNLTVQDEALVSSLGVRGGRVQSVRYLRNGQPAEVSAGRVVLTAGVFHSPQILLLSGIGPAAYLREMGIEVTHDLPGVGFNYQDHPAVSMAYEAPRQFEEKMIMPGFRIQFQSDPSVPHADFHIFITPPLEIPGLPRMISVHMRLVEQRNRGRVSLASLDPTDLPHLDATMLEHPEDQQAMVRTMRYFDDFVHRGALDGAYGRMLQPAAKDDWTQFARVSFDSYHHGCGTCLMGPASNAMAVVDPTLRVHGLANLWVADASIMPTIPHANTNLTVIMIAERLAGFMKAA